MMNSACIAQIQNEPPTKKRGGLNLNLVRQEWMGVPTYVGGLGVRI